MKYLSQGFESNERIDLLLELTNISSPSIIASLKYHLVDGLAAPRAYRKALVDQPNFKVALDSLNKKARIVELVKEHDAQTKNNCANNNSTSYLNQPLKLVTVSQDRIDQGTPIEITTSSNRS